MRAVVSLSGRFQPCQTLRVRIGEAERVIAADGGLDHLHKLDILPDEWMGDMDSVSEEARAWLSRHRNQVQIRRFDPNKNFTDGELALRAAVESGADEILIIGAFSEVRPDHVLANILMASKTAAQFGVAIELTDGETDCHLLVGPRKIEFNSADAVGMMISLLPLSERLTGVSYTGLRYTLNDHTLSFGSARAVSNSIDPSSSKFTIEIRSGSGALFITPDDACGSPSL
ncbi:MAG: thiamine diphosphokinase [Fastidiosipilaceae bacterium]|jgi:thiamine pyrophosphokinase